MLLENKYFKNIFFLGLAIAWLASASLAFAQEKPSLYQNSLPKDTDFDGLTDQGEVRIFFTNPALPDTDGDGYLDSAEVLMGSDPLDLHDPEVAFALQRGALEPKEIPWPWYIARTTGWAGYFLISILVILGISIQTRIVYKIIKPVSALAIHRFLGIALSVIILTHIISLLFDKYLKFTIIDVLVPLASPYRPLFVSLGIVGFYLFLAVIITSLFFRLKWPKLWRLLHYLTYPMLVLIFFHGVLSGTDAKLPLIERSYQVINVIAIGFMLFRLYRYWQKRQAAKSALMLEYEKTS